MIAGDFNGDGSVDLVVSDEFEGLFFLPNRGDGDVDLAVANYGDNSVSVLLNLCR